MTRSLYSKYFEPCMFVNIHVFDGKEVPSDEVFSTRSAALEEAKQWPDRYCYTLTDRGMIQLLPRKEGTSLTRQEQIERADEYLAENGDDNSDQRRDRDEHGTYRVIDGRAW